MIKSIIFDLGGVLLDLDMNKCFENFKALGVDMDRLNKMSTNISNGKGATLCEGITASGLLNLYQIGKVSTNEFFDTILKLTNGNTTYQQVLDAWNSCLLTIPQYKLDFIKEIRAEGYKTYLLSNTNDAHWQYIERNNFPEPVSNYFHQLFLSQEMGMAKPNAEIYEEMLRQISTPAEECLFLDDSSANCKAAEALGIHSYNVSVRTDFREEVRSMM